jgi:uncharacterized membrane protein
LVSDTVVAERNSRKVTLIGIVLAAAGLSHFIKPDLYEAITAPAFPDDTAKHIQINGSIETALGLGLAVRKTRKLALLGVLGYLGYLGTNAARNR